MNPPKGIESRKAPVVHDAGCEEPGCDWSQQDRTAQAAARDHARKFGHAVYCTTIIERRYVPTLRAERLDAAVRQADDLFDDFQTSDPTPRAEK